MFVLLLCRSLQISLPSLLFLSSLCSELSEKRIKSGSSDLPARKFHLQKYSAFTNQPDRNCHFPAPCINCVLRFQEAMFDGSGKTLLLFGVSYSLPTKSRVLTVAVRFISKTTTLCGFRFDIQG
jgi:hypothetical protein